MDPIHTIFYKHKFTTNAKDWKAMLKRTYFWIDWFSMPQPGAEKVEDIGKKKMDVLKAEGSKAIRSIPAYVERWFGFQIFLQKSVLREKERF